MTTDMDVDVDRATRILIERVEAAFEAEYQASRKAHADADLEEAGSHKWQQLCKRGAQHRHAMEVLSEVLRDLRQLAHRAVFGTTETVPPCVCGASHPPSSSPARRSCS